MPCTPMVVCPAVTGYWCATPAVVAVTKASGEKLATPLPAAFQPSNCNAIGAGSCDDIPTESGASFIARPISRSEEHTSELQSLMRISSAVFCLKKKKNTQQPSTRRDTQNN